MIEYRADGSTLLTDGADESRMLLVPSGGDVEAAIMEFFTAPVPEAVSPRQIKLALLAEGMLDPIEAFVSGADRAVQIAWEYAVEFRREDPLLTQMAAGFGMSSGQVDDLFRHAATL